MKLTCYMLLYVSCSSNPQASTMFVYLKKEIKLRFTTVIEDRTIYSGKILSVLTFANKNLF